MSDKKYYEINSITKVCKLIETLATRSSWELTDLCKALDYPKTTIHRMLLTLLDNGYVIHEQSRGSYSLSFKLLSIGNSMLAKSSIVDIARPFCKKLRDTVNETVNLCIVSGKDILVIDKQTTNHTLRQDAIVGSSFPIRDSASGKIFLAFAEEMPQLFYDYVNSSEKKESPAQSSKLADELETIRKIGLAYDYEEVFSGVRCVAAPIFDYQENLVAAISVSVPSARLDEQLQEKLNKEISLTAQDISLRLGSSKKF